MSGTRNEHLSEGGTHAGSEIAHVSVPWIVCAAVLCGIGLFLLSYWLTYFYWPAFSGAAFVLVGALLLFNRRTGLDHA